ncbi:hypothetical protein ACFV23_11825, partial [Streptomyces sp. NPDC059627]
MVSSQADKAASHARIVNTAAARFRRDGVNGVGVAELMKEAGLTHGGANTKDGSPKMRVPGPRPSWLLDSTQRSLCREATGVQVAV